MFYAISPYSLVAQDITHENTVKVQRNHFSMLALSTIAMLSFIGFSSACWYTNWSFHLTQTQNLIAGCLMILSISFFILGIGYCLTRRSMLKRLRESEPIEVEKTKESNPNMDVKV